MAFGLVTNLKIGRPAELDSVSSRNDGYCPSPLTKSIVSSVAMLVCGDQVAAGVKGVVDGRVSREKSLGCSPALETLRLAFPSAGWLMRVLSPVVTPSTRLMVLRYPKVLSSRSICTQVIRDQEIGDKTIFLEELAHQFQRSMLTPFRLN